MTRDIEIIETDLKAKGYRYVVGIDEVGRGPLAGDVISCALCLDLEKPIEGIKDSKKLSEKKREDLAQIIKKEAVAYSLAGAGPDLIDKVNIKRATIKTMEMALDSLIGKLEYLSIRPDIVLVDSEQIRSPFETLSLDKGDDRSQAIGAASILAKVYRDRLCLDWDKAYPDYGLARHKGYGTQAHIKALVRYGPSPIHRKSFLKNMAKWRENSYILGGLGEDLVKEYYEKSSYKLLDQNYSYHTGEIDLIFEKDNILAFVEVKLRKNTKYGHGHEYVSAKQKSRIVRTAQAYIVENDLEDYQYRFDIGEVYTETGSIVVYEDAFY